MFSATTKPASENDENLSILAHLTMDRNGIRVIYGAMQPIFKLRFPIRSNNNNSACFINMKSNDDRIVNNSKQNKNVFLVWWNSMV